MPVKELHVVRAVIQQPCKPRMHERKVVALEEVVHVRLPVAGHLEDVAARVPHRREVDRRDALGNAAVDRVEVGNILVQRDEHQALPLAYPKRRQTDVSRRELRGVLHFRRADQPARLVVEPSVVLAAQVVHALAAAMRERPGPMPADVRERTQHAVVAAQQDHRRSCDDLDYVVAQLHELLTVRDELPRMPKDGTPIHLVHGGADVVTCVEGVGRAQRLGRGRSRPGVHR